MNDMAGRNTLYDPEFVTKGIEYADGGWKECEGHNIPSVAGFARILKVTRPTIYNWADDYPEFFDTLEFIKAEQEFVALNKGIIGEYVVPITKLVLHNHGYSDKAQTDVISSDGSVAMPKAIRLVAPEFEDAE